MDRRYRKLALTGLLFSMSMGASAVHAATPIDMSGQHNLSVLHAFITSPTAAAVQNASQLREISRNKGVGKMQHIRFQQTYAGYPVFGADIVMHVPTNVKGQSLSQLVNTKGAFTDGTLFQDLNGDLANTPAYVFDKTQAQRAMQQAVTDYQQKIGQKIDVKNAKSDLIVFIDEQNKAHWAYKVTFFAPPVADDSTPVKPLYIMDAVSFTVYKEWNDLKTRHERDNVEGGGFGGNKKMGKLVYDGLGEDLPILNIEREVTAGSATCYLQNADVLVKKCTSSDWFGQCSKSIEFSMKCPPQDPDHNNVYWDGDMDAVNGGYSPGNDALFNGMVIKDMYMKWYDVPVLTRNGKPLQLTMVVHLQMDNAYWDDQAEIMNFGDGQRMFYPLTSLGVAAHEISHGFTSQHSNLVYSGQSGGMNEAYSDMAAQAAEEYAYGKATWQIGAEIFKADNQALRYMDKPSKDCNGKTPGDRCSLDDKKQYDDYKKSHGNKDPDVHYTSGIYNHFFYILGTKEGWSAKKAFNIMVHANMNYWTSSVTFEKGACGVLSAARELGEDVDAVQDAFKQIYVDTSACK